MSPAYYVYYGSHFNTQYDAHIGGKNAENSGNILLHIFFDLLYSGKPDCIKKAVLINAYKEGCLQVSHVTTSCDSLKASRAWLLW